jgi:hypothetical protein
MHVNKDKFVKVAKFETAVKHLSKMVQVKDGDIFFVSDVLYNYEQGLKEFKILENTKNIFDEKLYSDYELIEKSMKTSKDADFESATHIYPGHYYDYWQMSDGTFLRINIEYHESIGWYIDCGCCDEPAIKKNEEVTKVDMKMNKRDIIAEVVETGCELKDLMCINIRFLARVKDIGGIKKEEARKLVQGMKIGGYWYIAEALYFWKKERLIEQYNQNIKGLENIKTQNTALKSIIEKDEGCFKSPCGVNAGACEACEISYDCDLEDIEKKCPDIYGVCEGDCEDCMGCDNCSPKEPSIDDLNRSLDS